MKSLRESILESIGVVEGSREVSDRLISLVFPSGVPTNYDVISTVKNNTKDNLVFGKKLANDILDTYCIKYNKSDFPEKFKNKADSFGIGLLFNENLSIIKVLYVNDISCKKASINSLMAVTNHNRHSSSHPDREDMFIIDVDFTYKESGDDYVFYIGRKVNKILYCKRGGKTVELDSDNFDVISGDAADGVSNDDLKDIVGSALDFILD